MARVGDLDFDTSLRMGVAVRDITPDHPMPLSGFAHRTGVSCGVDSPLFLRVFAFESDQRAVVIVADLIGWDAEDARKIETNNQVKFGAQLTILSATHTHSAPCMLSYGHSLVNNREEVYMDFLHRCVEEAVRYAFENLEAVKLFSNSSSAAGLIVNRRLPTPDGIRALPNPEGALDPEVCVWRFDRVNGSAKAFWIHMACHPTILAGNSISSDFPGDLVRKMEEAHPASTCAFLQGCAGDLRPNLIDDQGAFRRTGVEDLRAFGANMYRRVEDSCRESMTPTGDACLKIEKHTIFGKTFDCGEVVPEDKIRMVGPVVPIRLSALRLTENAALLALPGEPSVFYQQFIKSLRDEDILPLGYCNGMPGYLPTAEQIREGGYESSGSCRYFGLAGPFQVELETEICNAAVGLVEKLFISEVVKD